MHILKQFIWRNQLEEYDETPNYTYFERQYAQIFSINVYFSTNNIMCMHLNKRYNPHLNRVAIRSTNRTAHVEFHYVQNLWMSLNLLKTYFNSCFPKEQGFRLVSAASSTKSSNNTILEFLLFLEHDGCRASKNDTVIFTGRMGGDLEFTCLRDYIRFLLLHQPSYKIRAPHVHHPWKLKQGHPGRLMQRRR